MGIKPSGDTPVIVPPDNPQNRWGEWEADLRETGEVAGGAASQTWSLADSAGQLAQEAWNGLTTVANGAVQVVGKILEGALGAGSVVIGGIIEIGSSIIGAAIDGVKGLFGAVASMIGNIFRRDDTPPEPLPDIYSPIAADLEEKLQPFLATVDEALEGSRTAGTAADKAIDDLAALIDPDNEDSKLWQAQNAIDRLQNERDEYQDIAIEANRKATEALQQYVTRVMFLPDSATVNSVENPHWNVFFLNGKRRIAAKAGWVGEWIYHSAVHRSGDFGPVIEGGEVTPSARIFDLDTPTSSATLQYTIRPGVPVLIFPPSVQRWVPAAKDVWDLLPVSAPTHLTNGVFTASTTTEHEILFRVGWDSTTRGDSYAIRIQRRANLTATPTTVEEIFQVGIGPLLPGQDGYRTQTITLTLSLNEGEVIDFWVKGGAGGSNERRVRDSKIQVSWVNPAGESDIT